MSKSLTGGHVKFTHTRADGTRQVVDVEVKEGDLITVEREYKEGGREERQIYPQATGYAPVRPVWKSENEK